MSTPLGGDLPDWQRRVSSQDDVYIGLFTSSGGIAPTIDVSQYNSLILDGGNLAANNQFLQLVWKDPAGRNLCIDNVSQADGVTFPQLTVPVRAQLVQVFYNNSTLLPAIGIYGSQRSVEQAISNGFPSPLQFFKPSAALLANTVYNLGPDGPQGWAQVDLIVSNPAVTGEFLISYNDLNGQSVSQRFADTTEFHTIGGNAVFHGQVILPHVPYTIAFICRTAGTAALTCNVIAAGR